MITVAINGFGRIGRNFLRAVLQDPVALKKINIVAINIGPARIDFVAHLFKYDTLMGTYSGIVGFENNELIIDGHRIKLFAQKDPADLPWKQLDIDWVVESSGKFTQREGALQHIAAGARHVLITAPAHDEDVAIIPGVNIKIFKADQHKIVSLGSCTTNAFIPLLNILHTAWTIKQGFMTTVHAYTNSQVLLDVEARDLRISRAAALNIIPTTTGASTMLGKVLPALNGLISAMSIRVPVGKVSLIDLQVMISRSVTVEQINDLFIHAAQTDMRGIVGFTKQPLVSSDFSGSDYSVTVDGLLTSVQGPLVQVFGWYDNEWGYSVRLKDFLVYNA
jgi:glyceraldehyde 3-phosphate dehydrogenase